MSLLGLRPLGEPDGLWFSHLPVRQGLPYVTPSSLQGGILVLQFPGSSKQSG